MRRTAGRKGLRASARPGGWSALGLSVVSAAAAVVLILTTGATSGSPASGLSLGHHGQHAVTHFKLSANATPTPPSIAPNTNARQALISVQNDLGPRLSAATWSSQPSPGGTGNLSSVSALDNTHVWAAGAACTLLFSANGTTWAKDTHVPGGCSANLTGVSVQDNSHGWAVGVGVVLVCNTNCNTLNATWTALTGAGAPSGVSFTGVWGNGNTVYASTANAVWVCSANCNSATAGSGGGKSTWTNVSLSGAWMSVAAAGGGTPAFLVGSGGAMRMCKTAPCTTAAAWASVGGFGGVNFASVWAVDGNHIYAVGANGGNGVIWACSAGCNSNAPSWANVTPSAPSTAPPALAGVAGAGGPDGSAWTAGSGGAIWFCPSKCSTLPTEWVKESPPSPTSTSLAGVTGSDANHAWAVGPSGYIAGMVASGQPADAITKSLQALGQVLDPTLWVGSDGNHVDPAKFHQVFDRAKSAEAPLDGLKLNPPQTWPANNVQLIEGAMRLLATTEMADNACSPQKAKELTEAQKELDAGDQEWAKGHPDHANDHYEAAYDHANKAKGVACAGLSVTPVGSLFTVTNMVPGDSFPTPNPGDPDAVLVTVTSTPGTVTLSTANVTGALSSKLNITVVEYQVSSSTQQLYTGPLTSFPATLPLLNNTGGATWATNEAHNFVITVDLPVSTGNAYQGTDSSFDLKWTRS